MNVRKRVAVYKRVLEGLRRDMNWFLAKGAAKKAEAIRRRVEHVEALLRDAEGRG
jgi:hypothetical protein